MRLTCTPNMLRKNVLSEIEGFHSFVQVYSIRGNMSLILPDSTWPVAPICGLEQIGSQHCFDLNDRETKRI